jgi:hypothetical protein
MENQTKEEVKLFFTSWLDGKYKDKFAGYDGKTLLVLSKEDMKGALGGLDGSALYNVLHPQGESNGTRKRSFVKNAIVFKSKRDLENT